jgi:hypothetical protein
MLNLLFIGWGKSVVGLFIGDGTTSGLPTTTHNWFWGPVDNIGRFYQSFTNLIPALFHDFAAQLISVTVLVLPAIHTTYYYYLRYLFNSSNSRRLI